MQLTFCLSFHESEQGDVIGLGVTFMFVDKIKD